MSFSMKDKTFMILGFGTVVLVIGGLAVLAASQRVDTSTLSTREVALSCTTDMATAFHIHPRLAITVDGVDESLPMNIGIRSGCMNPLHTHEEQGVIHVESPVQRDFTLGDFFAVWGEPLAREGYALTVLADGTIAPDPESVVFKDDQQIELLYSSK